MATTKTTRSDAALARSARAVQIEARSLVVQMDLAHCIAPRLFRLARELVCDGKLFSSATSLSHVGSRGASRCSVSRAHSSQAFAIFNNESQCSGCSTAKRLHSFAYILNSAGFCTAANLIPFGTNWIGNYHRNLAKISSMIF